MAWDWYEHLIYPEWYMHNRAHDAVSQQASKTSSLEHRVDRLEQKIEKLEHHILGLETLLASHGIVPPMLEEVPGGTEPKTTGEPVTFPARTEETIVCPRCGRKQKGNRSACYSCGTPFVYETE